MFVYCSDPGRTNRTCLAPPVRTRQCLLRLFSRPKEVRLTCESWKIQGVTSLLAPAAGVRGLELPGLGRPLSRVMASLTELFLFRDPPPGANAGRLPPWIELASEFCLLPSWPTGPAYSSPKNPCNFLRYLPLMLFEPVDETVVALAIDGRRSSSFGKRIPPGGAYPGEIWLRFSFESL